MEEAEKEKINVSQAKTETLKQVNAIKEKITKGDGDVKNLENFLSELEVKTKKIEEHEAEMKKKEQKAPWNVDTISKPGFAKTVINKEAIRPKYSDMTEEEKDEQMKAFVKENMKIVKQYGMLRKYDDSKKFLLENHKLVCEDTANYLVIWCINLQMEDKSELMAHVAHQCICMQYILELSKQLDVDPRSCVTSFFTRIQVAELEYKKQFDSEVTGFIERITKRAEEKTQAAIAEAEEEERQERLGPGGLDPVEVFESLPIVSFFFWVFSFIFNLFEIYRNFNNALKNVIFQNLKQLLLNYRKKKPNII